MALLNFILNLAALLLWLGWRSRSVDSPARPAGIALISTLKKAGPAGGRIWMFALALGALLFLRALLYWQIGPALHWTPVLSLGAASLSFKSMIFARMLLFSFLSFGAFLAGFYFWLLLLSAVNQQTADTDPWQSLVRAHLGRLDRQPAALKFFLPVLLTALLWLGLGPLLTWLDINAPAKSFGHVAQQSVVIGLGAMLAWKPLLAAVLLLHTLASYVYLGNTPFWSFISVTARQLLRPLHRLPLRAGKVDFAPLAGIALVFLIAELADRALPCLYRRLPF
ncbi:MAG: hypothetical protein EXS33_03420 [Pedosphaera sp.]|nr:hypothetical protein [Pedosphaera sp.]